jgi:hypothetical protein
MWRHRHRPLPAPVADTESEELPAALPAPRLAYERPPAQPAVRKRGTTGMATVRGRVVGAPAPREDVEEELTLVISDEESELDAAVEADGSFVIELAPGTYRLHVELDEMEATMDAVTVGAGEDREVILQLTGAVSIKGTLRPPNEETDDGGEEEANSLVEIRASGESTWSESEDATIEDNQFTVTGLDAGQRYDLRFSVDGFRPVELTGISAPSEGLVVNLVKPARLSGGFGIARGEKCPISYVTIAVEDEQAQVLVMDTFCRFQSGDLPPAPRVRVQVSEDDWSFDVLVDIPPHGDPPFLCLRSLCREPAYDEVSTLEISLGDLPDKGFFASIACDRISRRVHAAAGEIARVTDFPSGSIATVAVFAHSCRSIVQTVELQPGVNRLSLACQKR